jgi:hypothetical protein
MTGTPLITHLRFPAACLLVLARPAPAPAAGPPAAREKLRELRGRIDALQNALRRRGIENEAVDALRESERAISDANRSLRELAEQGARGDARPDELAGSRARPAGAQNSSRRFARQLYQPRGRKNGAVEDPAQPRNPNQIARHLHYFGNSRARAGVISDPR